jgi:uncharacterized protein YwqG
MLIADSPLADAGRQHLDAEDAATWIGLLRPGFHLRRYVSGEEIVGYVGGNPQMPEDMDWPVWADHGPLTFVGAVDCGALPTKDLDIPLPEDGALLFFYFDGQVGDGDSTVGYWDPESLTGGSRVLYIPADSPMVDREAPEEITAYSRILLAGDLIATDPDPEHAAFVAAFGDPYDPAAPDGAHAVVGGEFSATLDEIRQTHAPQHQIGGYALPVQETVEDEAAYAVSPGKEPEAVEARAALSARLVLLAQIDSDDRNAMEWGDGGRLYWLIDPDDLAARRFDATAFTWQGN